MRFIGEGILLREGVGEIGIKQEVLTLPLEQESTLSQPPEMDVGVVLAAGCYIAQEDVVLLERLNHG
jgi:hypothetical protein